MPALEVGGTHVTAAGLRTVAIPTLASHELTADWVWSSLDDPTLLAWAQTW